MPQPVEAVQDPVKALFLKPTTVDFSRLAEVHRQMSIILMQKQVDTCTI